MSRRRLTLAAYVRRRWRSVGAVLVLVLGGLLVLAVTDRGHDPVWETRAAEIDQAVIAPDASVVYTLLREEGNVTSLLAARGETGERLWESPLHTPRAILAAAEAGVAVATDFPLAVLTVYHADGSPRWQLPLDGNPVAMAMDGERIALALNAPGNPVLLFDGDLLIRTYRLPSPVRALDLEAGLVASGGLQGEVVVYRDRVEEVNVTLAMGVRSLRLSLDGTALVVGGFGLTAADPRGQVAYLDLVADDPVRWQQDTLLGVGLIDVDALGLVALAVEEAPPTATVHLYEGSSGATRWTLLLPGSISRLDSGALGGAALSPDGAAVAVASQGGRLRLLDADDGSERWNYRAGGAAIVTFADDDPRRLVVGARLLENRPYDSLLLFSLAGEPLSKRAPLLAAATIAAGAATLTLLVGVGFWRARRPY